MLTQLTHSPILPFSVPKVVPMSAIVTTLDQVIELQLVLPNRIVTKYFDSQGELEAAIADLPLTSISYEEMNGSVC
jgi:hypothetical protein